MAYAKIMLMVEGTALPIAGHSKGQVEVVGPAVLPRNGTILHIRLGVLPVDADFCLRTGGLIKD